MKKIEFINGQAPYLNDTNLNELQDNMEEVSVPPEGTIGQILAKASNADNDVEWIDNVKIIDNLTDESSTKALSAKQGKLLYEKIQNGETGLGTAIPSSADLNSYINPGTYYSINANISASLSNTPITATGFRLEVKPISTNDRYRQEIYANSTSANSYCRTFTANGWSEWRLMDFNDIGSEISSGSNLNSFTKPGAYYSNNADISASLSHCPVTTVGFRMEVKYTSADNRYRQEIYANNTASDTYYRTYTANGWQSWRKVTTEAV